MGAWRPWLPGVWRIRAAALKHEESAPLVGRDAMGQKDDRVRVFSSRPLISSDASALKNPALKVQGFKVRLEVASILKNKY